jgi:hypothetical protein
MALMTEKQVAEIRRRERIYQLGLNKLAGVGEAATTIDPRSRMARSVLVSEDLWRWTRIRAINTDRTAGDVVEEALGLLRETVEGEDPHSAP